jgi:threonine/homoserine/homoserine lactone efflux protein
VLTTSALAFTVVKDRRGLLLWLAIGMLRDAWHGRAPETAVAKVAPASLRTIFAQGFLTNVLNPKVALFFLALLPQFIDSDAVSKPLAFLFLGAIFIVNGTLFLFALVAVAAHARRLRVAPNARRAECAGGAVRDAPRRLAMAEHRCQPNSSA